MAKAKQKRRIIYVGESSYPSTELTALLAAGALPLPGRAARALEVGCGTASDALLLTRLGYDTSAVDNDPLALAVARRRASRMRLPLRFEEAEATALPFPDASFDLILDRLLWNNLLDDGRLPDYLDELARVARPGASLVVRAKSPHWWNVEHAYQPAVPGELGGKAVWRKINSNFKLVRPPMRFMLLDPYGGLVPSVVALLNRRGSLSRG